MKNSWAERNWIKHAFQNGLEGIRKTQKTMERMMYGLCLFNPQKIFFNFEAPDIIFCSRVLIDSFVLLEFCNENAFSFLTNRRDVVRSSSVTVIASKFVTVVS